MALQFLNAAKGLGVYLGWLRRGLDLYLSAADYYLYTPVKPLFRSLACYLLAGELGIYYIYSLQYIRVYIRL